MMAEDTEFDKVTSGLARLAERMPRSVATRIESTLIHMRRSKELRQIDLEMSSFRAICSEEEAATAVIHALYHRKYSSASLLNSKSHRHKWAIVGCIIALRPLVQPILREFQLVFDYKLTRIDLKIPLTNFGIEGPSPLAVQPVEPLDLLHSKPGKNEDYAFEDELAALAEGAEFEDIKKMVQVMANSRNRLLYATDTEVPKSQATPEQLDARSSRAVSLLVIAVMITQSKKRLAAVRQALPAVLKVIGRIPDSQGN